MIFASLGTMNMPFERMAKAVDDLAEQCDEKVIVQTGHTDYDYHHADSFRFCSKEEMEHFMDEANIVILQGGWGSISEAIEKNKRIVAIPRHNHTEHIHDQFQLVKKLDTMGCIIGVFDEKELPQKVKEAYSFIFKPLRRGNAESLIEKTISNWFPQSKQRK